MSNNVLYTGKTLTTGGREGRSRSSDNRLDINLSVPGSAGNGTNPEQLFAAAWSACFMGAMRRVAQARHVHFPQDATVAAEVDLLSSEEQGFSLQARLNVSLPGIDRDTAQALVDGAHQLCPYSKATRGNIAVELNVV